MSNDSKLQVGIVAVNGVRIDFDRPEITDSMKIAFESGRFENSEVKVLEATLESNDRVVELGGSTGYLTMFAAKICGSENVFSYEANPSACCLARHHFIINSLPISLTDAVLLPRKMIANESPYLQFFVHSELVSGSFRKTRKAIAEVSCPVLCAEEEIKRRKASYLVVDIEGGEYDFFTKIHERQQNDW